MLTITYQIIKIFQWWYKTKYPCIYMSFKYGLGSGVKMNTLVRLVSYAIFHHTPIKSEVVLLYNDGKCQEIQIGFWQMW